MIKKILIILCCSLVAINGFALDKSSLPKIYINQFAPHPALDQTTRGIIDGLSKAGYENNKSADIKVESAQGNVILSGQISSKFISKKPDIVVGIGTISAQSLSKYAKGDNAKLIFSTVTDPVGAGLVQTIDKTANNTSGVSNFVPLMPQLSLLKQIKPSIKKLGFLYNPGEFNSVSLIEKLKIACADIHIELVTMPATKSSEVAAAAIKLSSLVDAIFISNDNTALSAMQTIVKAANEVNIPVFVSDTDIVKDGAVAALGPNQYEIGLQTANMIVRILGGKDINNAPVEFPAKTELYLNLTAAKKLGITISDSLKQQATKVIE